MVPDQITQDAVGSAITCAAVPVVMNRKMVSIPSIVLAENEGSMVLWVLIHVSSSSDVGGDAMIEGSCWWGECSHATHMAPVGLGAADSAVC